MSWISISAASPFSLRNIPFGVVSTAARSSPRPAVAIGEYVLDLAEFSAGGGFSKLSELSDTSVFEKETNLNAFAALGRSVHRAVRNYLQQVFTKNGPFPDVLENNSQLQKSALLPASQTKNHLPMAIGDYTDFYVGKNHAYNCGVLFRGPDNALQPNYYHLPVGYHGRASSIVLSGTPLHRPIGQILENPTATPKKPVLAPCKRLDYELELAAFISVPNKLGERVSIDQAEDHIFGYVMMNDWSARDVQAWEYVPLGPFTAKNFGTSISPWVVLHDALEPFRTAPLPRPEPPLEYLQEKRQDSVFNINLQVDIETEKGSKATVSKGNAKYMLFSFPQMVAHHTITGCNLNPGDLFGSGTLSTEDRSGLGSLLELSHGGKEPIEIGSEKRTFLQDGDTVTFLAAADDGSGKGLVGFGPVSGKILPAQ